MNGSPKTLASNIAYLPFGGITGLIYGNGLSLSQGYDNQYRMTSVVVGSILNLTYEFDANGNATSILDAVNPPGGEALETQGAYSYQQGSNKLTNISAATPINFGYDPNGNITSENTRTLVYDLSNQLVTVSNNSNQVAAYTYNGPGQRIKKATQAETRIFHYDLSDHLIAETNQAGQLIAEYIYLGDQLLAKVQGEQPYYFHNDHLGTPQVLTNDAGNILWKATYTPFGKAQISIQTVENPFRFPGQYYDQETGLHYNYFRYYDAMTGRYITPDPIGLEGGVNLFSYAENDPVNMVDPYGQEVQMCQRAFKPLPRRFGPIHHSYLNVNGTLYGFHPAHNRPCDKGKVEIEQPGKDIKCGKPLKCVDDSCVLKYINMPTQNYYFGFGDCRSWPEIIILLCHKKDCCE